MLQISMIFTHFSSFWVSVKIFRHVRGSKKLCTCEDRVFPQIVAGERGFFQRPHVVLRGQVGLGISSDGLFKKMFSSIAFLKEVTISASCSALLSKRGF